MLRRSIRINGRALGWIMIAIIVAFGARVWSLYEDGRAIFLQVTMRSSVDGKAVVYYDVGEGLSEKGCEREVVEKGNDFRQYRFRLPNRTIHYLRFDPLSSDGHSELDIPYTNARWYFPMLNNMGSRILKNGEMLQYFADQGLPVTPALKKMAGEWGSSNNWQWYKDPSLPTQREWLYLHGRQTYMKYLLTHPAYTLQSAYH